MELSYRCRPAVSLLHECFRANLETGKLFWKVRPRSHFRNERGFASFNARYPGKEALAGYNEFGCGGRITFCGVRFAVRRSHVLWAMKHGTWPTLEIGHRNQDFHDDRIDNLRQQTESQKASFGRRTSGKTGVKGVLVVPSGKFVAHITVLGKRAYLGTFATLDAARLARNAAALARHGEFARLTGAAQAEGA